MNDQSPVVKTDQLSFRYNAENVLKDVSLSVEKGDFLGIVGPNGSGKTTLLKIILGLLKPDSGSIEVLGTTPQQASSHIGYVPQQVNMDRNFPINILDVVLLGCLNERPFFGRYSKREKEKAKEALQEVDLYDLRNRRFGTLSGGERQRVLIARALVGHPQLLIMDEPTSNIDSWSQNRIYELLQELNQRCTILLVSHDLGVVSKHVNRVACLNRTLVIHPTKEITGDSIRSMYQTPVNLVDHEMHL